MIVLVFTFGIEQSNKKMRFQEIIVCKLFLYEKKNTISSCNIQPGDAYLKQSA